MAVKQQLMQREQDLRLRLRLIKIREIKHLPENKALIKLDFKNAFNQEETGEAKNGITDQFATSKNFTWNTAAERIDEMSGDLKQQLKAVSSRFEHFSITLDETVDITGIAQLAVFIRVCDIVINIYEELLELFPMHDTTASQDIFEKVEQFGHKDSELHQRPSSQPPPILPVVGKLDNQFNDVPTFTEVRWLSCYKVFKRFYLLRQEIIMVLEMKGQNTEEIKDESWLQDHLGFAVDITEQLTALNLKLQDKNKLITQL
ncbi:general transcription factor II-I repeat domain-containing protein 2-like [Procambarus clarkii]|uniref:general transcription factor II-I repeat domain-containing protein 2-like n=1 Tax=Procambarus clarkii TaxID=6728 RepID=UPI003743224C